MNNTICNSCGKPISNEYGVTPPFCANCGARLNADPPTAVNNDQRREFGLGAIVLTSVLTSMVVLVIGGFGLYYLLSSRTGQTKPDDPETTQTKKPQPTVAPTRVKRPSSVAASEITKVVWSRWHHEGPLMGGGRVVSNTLEFTSDLVATRTESINYDSDDKNDKTIKLAGRIDRGHFDKLSEILVENDFLNEPDSPDRITESENALIITYTSGEKKIKLSNTSAKDSPEMEDVMTTLTALNAFVRWAEVQ